MTKRRLRNVGRDKALFGSSSGAILTAAGINVAGTLAAASIGANAAKKAAQDQAKATIQSAQRQAQAIRDQTAKSREYQLESQEFIKEQNTENRELQKDIQLQLQMLTGQQGYNDRLEASKLKVKAGGKTRGMRYTQSLLRGGNMPFRVTDGGGVVPVGVTPEGFELYEILGNDHEHYHRTRGGKYKSGVGIKFADGNVVEGEGNQKKNDGELMLVTPNNAFFISKHTINGVNPKRLVEQGMHPLQAYNIQEQEKNIIGINDDGTKAKYGKRGIKFLIGGTPNLYYYTNMSYPQVGTDTIGDTTVGVVYGTQGSKDKRTLKCGGSTRRKAPYGTFNWSTGKWETNGIADENIVIPYAPGKQPVELTNNNGSSGSGTNNGINSSTNRNSNTWIDRNADLLGAGINALGNIGGALITSSANRSASRTLADAYRRGADIMAGAYNSLKTISMNNLKKEDYAAAHMMPVIQAPISFAASNVAGVDRKLQRRLRNAGRYSASSAAAQERMANAEVESQDEKNKIYSADQQQMQQIRQANAERVSEAAKVNAMLDNQANERYSQDYLKLLQYNNDIENSKILGAAGATSEGAINGASAIAQGQTAGAQAWATALANSGLTFSNTLSSMAKRKADLENIMLGATIGGRVNYLSRYGNKRDKDRQKAAIQRAINSGGLSADDKAMYEYYLELLS